VLDTETMTATCCFS